MTIPTRAQVSRTRSTPRAAAAALASLLAAVLAAACSSAPPPEVEAADSAGDSPQAVATGVNATVIVAKCPDARRIKVRTAQATIQKLVDPCAKVPGGRAHFSATLLPGGRIELASPEGDPSEGVVPTCVLTNRLTHRVLLRSACTLDVQLDERTLPVPEAD
ncbi:MAG: hypothetical protein R3B70_11290 [Polyangiaceae bacterium]